MFSYLPTLTFTAELWLWHTEKGSWHFLTVPADYTPLLKSFQLPGSGFGSVRVRVTIGGSTWNTSVFPDSKKGAFLLPVKAAVRKAEGLIVGKAFDVSVSPKES